MKLIENHVIENVASTQNADLLILNEAIDFEKQCIFIAIPKTGTSTVRAQLKAHGSPLISNPHLSIMQVRDSIYVYFLTLALGKNRVFPSKAISVDSNLRAQANEVFNTFFKFASVRNPWARAVSLYFRREGIQLQNECSFEEFCKNHFYASDTCIHPTLHKNQFDWLCDESGRCVMDYVYKLEKFEEAIKDIEELTAGRLKIACQNINCNPKSPSREYRKLYTETTKNIIAKRFEKDVDYFKYTF